MGVDFRRYWCPLAIYILHLSCRNYSALWIRITWDPFQGLPVKPALFAWNGPAVQDFSRNSRWPPHPVTLIIFVLDVLLFYKKPVNACIVKYFICLHFIFQWESNQHAFYLILFKNLVMETAHVSLWTVRGFWILKYFSELKQEHRKHADSTSPNQDWHYCGQTNFDRNPCQLSIHHPLMLFWVMNSLELHFEKVFFYCTVYRRTIKWWESAAVVTEKKNIQDWIEVL